MTTDPRLAASVAALFAVGAVLMRLAQVRHALPAERCRRDWLKYAVYATVINALWLSAYAGRGAALVALGLIVVGGSSDVFRVAPAPWRRVVTALAALLFAAALAPMLLPAEGAWRDGFAFVTVVTAATDSFAELTGRLLGRRRLCPRLSPGKTVAGFWGGLAAAVLVALLLGFLLPGAGAPRVAGIGLLTALGAVGGDLAFSAVKRCVGVKDFSALLPAHGGVLDRFDSLLLAAPVFAGSRLLLG